MCSRAVPKTIIVYVANGPGGARLINAVDKVKSNPQILHLERTVPSASTVTCLVTSGSTRPSRNFYRTLRPSPGAGMPEAV
jgi:hypothetical protein